MAEDIISKAAPFLTDPKSTTVFAGVDSAWTDVVSRLDDVSGVPTFCHLRFDCSDSTYFFSRSLPDPLSDYSSTTQKHFSDRHSYPRRTSQTPFMHLLSEARSSPFPTSIPYISDGPEVGRNLRKRFNES